MDVDHRWDTSELADICAVALLVSTDSCSVADLRQEDLLRAGVIKEFEALRVGGDRESLELLRDDPSYIFMVD